MADQQLQNPGGRRAVGAGAGRRGITAPLRRTALAVALAAAPAAPAQEADSGAPPNLIVDVETVPLDALGQPQLDAVPGARDRQPLSAAVAQRLHELAEQRAAIGATSSAGPARAPVAPLAGDAEAPSRLDSIDRDPDRLRTLPPLPRAR